ncbi:MAG: spore germination protein [Oscillospiraceae bacterium]|nr:spore germination protein [Oscillospiraceae bacterium]
MRTIPDSDNFKNIPLPLSLDDKISDLRRILDNSSDLLINPIELGGVRTALVTMEGMVASDRAAQMIMEPLMEMQISDKKVTPDELFTFIRDRMMMTLDRAVSIEYGDIMRRIMSGFAVLMIDGTDKVFSLGIQGYAIRGVQEPSSEGNITGAHEGFVETVRTNMSLLRRRIKSPKLQFSLFAVSSESNVDVILCFMADRVPKNTVAKIKARLEKLPLEAVLGHGYAEPFLIKERLSFFSGLTVTERPDIMCARLLEGRIGLLIDGTPFALVIPSLFSDHFHTADDYNFRPFYATFIRLIRYAAFVLSVFLPGAYVSAAVHHRELLRSELLLNLASAETSAPLPIALEALIVLLFYEVIREAGVRLPKSVGGAVSIVGGLIIGDAAVTAGIITNPMLLVCAISVTASFVIPSLNPVITVTRLFCVVLGSIFGLYGVSLAAAAMLVSACSADNYGIPLTAPVTPMTLKAMGDTFIRRSLRSLSGRHISAEDYNGSYTDSWEE